MLDPGPALEFVAQGFQLLARRWRLDQVITNEGKPSELYYLVGVRPSVTRDRFLTAIRGSAGDKILAADLEIGDAVAQEKLAEK